MSAEEKTVLKHTHTLSLHPEDAFSRHDESNDEQFYRKDRMVHHLDSVALETVTRIIGALAVEKEPVILDLMASWDSHLPAILNAAKVTGLGLNINELHRNGRLTERIIHDLNAHPVLPFRDDTFDIVINTVSVDYMTKPVEVFSEVGRVLKPGGLFLVIFSNRMFPEKAVKIWRESAESQRVELVKSFFESASRFEEPAVFISSGKPRPPDDKYYHTGLPSDPVYAVYADKRAHEGNSRRRPDLTDLMEARPSQPAADEQPRSSSHSCPYCGMRLRKWTPPNSPFSTWDTEFLYICFNDECPYLVAGWQTMSCQGNPGMSYRHAHDPERGSHIPIPIISLHALKEGIVDE